MPVLIPIIPVCLICGETDSLKFYKEYRSRCKSCVIKNMKIDKAAQKQYYQDNILKARVYHARKRAKQRGLPCDITEKYLRELLIIQDNKCWYTDICFDNTDQNLSVSVDRTNPKLGYTKENVKLVLSVVNYMKQDISEELFMVFVEAINFKNKNIEKIKK